MFMWTENQELMYIVFNEYFIKQTCIFSILHMEKRVCCFAKETEPNWFKMYQTSFDEQEVIILSVSEKRKEKCNGLF